MDVSQAVLNSTVWRESFRAFSEQVVFSSCSSSRPKESKRVHLDADSGLLLVTVGILSLRIGSSDRGQGAAKTILRVGGGGAATAMVAAQ